MLGKLEDDAIDVDEEEDSEPDEVESDGDYRPKKKRAVIASEGEDKKPIFKSRDRVSRKVTRKAVIDHSDDSMDDFVVPDDMSESEMPPKRGKKRKSGGGGKGKGRAVVDSDTDEDDDDKVKVVKPWHQKEYKKKKSARQLMKGLPKFSVMKPSTKMLRMVELLEKAHEESNGTDKVRRPRPPQQRVLTTGCADHHQLAMGLGARALRRLSRGEGHQVCSLPGRYATRGTRRSDPPVRLFSPLVCPPLTYYTASARTRNDRSCKQSSAELADAVLTNGQAHVVDVRRRRPKLDVRCPLWFRSLC